MKLSIVVDAKGEIVGAAIPTGAPPVAGPKVMDQIRLAPGQQMHEVTMPSEVARYYLDGNLEHALAQCEVVREGGKVTLRLRRG